MRSLRCATLCSVPPADVEVSTARRVQSTVPAVLGLLACYLNPTDASGAPVARAAAKSRSRKAGVMSPGVLALAADLIAFLRVMIDAQVQNVRTWWEGGCRHESGWADAGVWVCRLARK